MFVSEETMFLLDIYISFHVKSYNGTHMKHQDEFMYLHKVLHLNGKPLDTYVLV